MSTGSTPGLGIGTGPTQVYGSQQTPPSIASGSTQKTGEMSNKSKVTVDQNTPLLSTQTKTKSSVSEIFQEIANFFLKLGAKFTNPQTTVKSGSLSRKEIKDVKVTLPYSKGAKLSAGNEKLNEFLKKPCAQEALNEHAISNSYVENIHFLKATNKLESLINKGDMIEANFVFSEMKKIFLSDDALLSTNLDDAERNALLKMDLESSDFSTALGDAKSSIEQMLADKLMIGNESEQIENIRSSKEETRQKAIEANKEHFEHIKNELGI